MFEEPEWLKCFCLERKCIFLLLGARERSDLETRVLLLEGVWSWDLTHLSQGSGALDCCTCPSTEEKLCFYVINT